MLFTLVGTVHASGCFSSAKCSVMTSIAVAKRSIRSRASVALRRPSSTQRIKHLRRTFNSLWSSSSASWGVRRGPGVIMFVSVIVCNGVAALRFQQASSVAPRRPWVAVFPVVAIARPVRQRRAAVGTGPILSPVWR